MKTLSRHTVHDTAVFYICSSLEQMLLYLSLLASPFECVLLPVFCFSGRGMALSFLLLSSAVLPLLSESAYNTSAGNDCAVSHKCLSLTQCLQLSVQNNCGCCSTMDVVLACRLLIWCMFACIFICEEFIWQRNVSLCWSKNSVGLYYFCGILSSVCGFVVYLSTIIIIIPLHGLLAIKLLQRDVE